MQVAFPSESQELLNSRLLQLSELTIIYSYNVFIVNCTIKFYILSCIKF